jgi:hypothetical protein
MRLLFSENDGGLNQFHHSAYAPFSKGTALAIKERLDRLGYPARVRSDVKLL